MVRGVEKFKEYFWDYAGQYTFIGGTACDIILFKIKAWLDLSERRENGEHIDSKNIKKHKNDIMRILLKNVMDCTIFRIHSDSLQLFQRKSCYICQRKHTCPTV